MDVVLTFAIRAMLNPCDLWADACMTKINYYGRSNFKNI